MSKFNILQAKMIFSPEITVQTKFSSKSSSWQVLKPLQQKQLPLLTSELRLRPFAIQRSV